MKRAWIIVGCLGVLAACGAPVDERARVAGVLKDDAPPPSSVVVQEANATPRAPLAKPPGAVKLTPPAPRPTEAPSRRVARAATPPASAEKSVPAEVKTVVPLFEPARLVGLGRSELADLMGTPQILRNEPPGEVWLYKSDACVAHVYLYEEAGPDDYRVSYVETRSVGAVVSSARCLAHLASGSASTVSLNEPQN
jgi:hypothetical protein